MSQFVGIYFTVWLQKALSPRSIMPGKKPVGAEEGRGRKAISAVKTRWGSWRHWQPREGCRGWGGEESQTVEAGTVWSYSETLVFRPEGEWRSWGSSLMEVSARFLRSLANLNSDSSCTMGCWTFEDLSGCICKNAIPSLRVGWATPHRGWECRASQPWAHFLLPPPPVYSNLILSSYVSRPHLFSPGEDRSHLTLSECKDWASWCL